jgi:hypothetical protein
MSANGMNGSGSFVRVARPAGRAPATAHTEGATGHVEGATA